MNHQLQQIDNSIMSTNQMLPIVIQDKEKSKNLCQIIEMKDKK